MLTQPSRGFSLVELMVAVGLFSMVMTLATGAYLLMINTNREAQAAMTGTNNLAYALEFMMRNITTGRLYECPTANSFRFRDVTLGKMVTYSYTGNNTTVGSIQESVEGVPGSMAVTEPTVIITNLLFTCYGTAPDTPTSGDDIQASVRINVAGYVVAGPGGNRVRDFSVQTITTMRTSDI